MGKRSVAGGVFVAAVLALLFWAFVTGALGDFMRNPAPYFGVAGEERTDDVLFEEPEDFSSDSVADTFDPVTDPQTSSSDAETDSSSDTQTIRTFEFILTPEYFNALLEKYSYGLPLRKPAASFASGQMILTGEIEVAPFCEMMSVPPAFTIFLPRVMACRLECVPEVSEGGVRVRVLSASAGSDLLAPYLSRPEILSEVERFLNRQLTEYLPDTYVMRSIKVSEGGLHVRYEILG